MNILAIETSCDETAIAVVKFNKDIIDIISNNVFSQIKIHNQYGGIIPEIAARNHVLKIIPVLDKSLSQFKKNKIKNKIDVIAVTVGPGLITSLMVGIETAKVLSYYWKKPCIAVNHIEGHIYANFINNSNLVDFPAIILTVSGGHTNIILMEKHLKYKVIGRTLDDAAGEAFDKIARLLKLSYPGGPSIANVIDSAKTAKKGMLNLNNVENIVLPRPMINSKDYNFSFSGLKTAAFYLIKKLKKNKKNLTNDELVKICIEVQQSIIDVLIAKTVRAAKNYKAKTVMLTGGVSANKELRKQMQKVIKINLPKTKFQTPDIKYTTDNAVMIARVAYEYAKRKKFTPWQKLKANPNLKI